MGAILDHRNWHDRCQEFSSSVGAAAAILPLRFPFTALSIYKRAEIFQSRTPGDISHSNFFQTRKNLWKGMSISYCMVPIYASLFIIWKEFAYQAEGRLGRELTPYENGATAALSGATVSFIATPSEVMLNQIQYTKDRKPLEVVRFILQTKGWRGIYCGFFPIAAKNSFFSFMLLLAVPEVKKKIDFFIRGDSAPACFGKVFLASCLVSPCYTILAVIPDFMSNLRQREPKKYKTGFHAIAAAYHIHGPRTFKAGLLMRGTGHLIEMVFFGQIRELLAGWYPVR